MTVLIEVENRFEVTRRDLVVRRKRGEETVEEQRVNWPAYEHRHGEEERRKVSFTLESVNGEGEEDYLEISVDNQQDESGSCRIGICSNGPVTFVPPEAESITVVPSEHGETDTSLRIPEGLPTWKLKIIRPPEPGSDEEFVASIQEGSMVNVTVGEDPPGG